MPTNDPRPTKAVRRDEARLKAAQMRKEQERKAKRNRILAISGLVVAVLALVAVAFTIVNQNKANQAANSDVVYGGDTANVVAPALADVTAPAPANDKGGIPVSGDSGDDVGVVGDGDVTLTVYFDFMCPICGQFEQINGDDIATLLADGGTTVEYHPISFLDSKSAGHLLLDACGQRRRDRRRQGPGAVRQVRDRDVQGPAGRGQRRSHRRGDRRRSPPTSACPRRSPATFTDDRGRHVHDEDRRRRGHEERHVAHHGPVGRRRDQPDEHGHRQDLHADGAHQRQADFGGAWQTPGALLEAVKAAQGS